VLTSLLLLQSCLNFVCHTSPASICELVLAPHHRFIHVGSDCNIILWEQPGSPIYANSVASQFPNKVIGWELDSGNIPLPQAHGKLDMQI